MALTPAEKQRRYQKRKQTQWDAMPKIECACGCGTLIPPINKQGKPATYAHGHNPSGIETRFKKGQTAPNKGRRLGPSPFKGMTTKERGYPDNWAEKRTRKRIERFGAYTSEDGLRRAIENRPDSWHTNITAANRRRDVSGSNNPAWQGGLSKLPYGPNWTDKLKRQIRERDGQICQHCSVTRIQHGRTLIVHHIDHDKMNNDPSNLVTVCHACNVYFSYHREESLLAFPMRRML